MNSELLEQLGFKPFGDITFVYRNIVVNCIDGEWIGTYFIYGENKTAKFEKVLNRTKDLLDLLIDSGEFVYGELSKQQHLLSMWPNGTLAR